MVVNLKAREISRVAFKLIRIFILIKKKSITLLTKIMLKEIIYVF